jgi:hypothetical protein
MVRHVYAVNPVLERDLGVLGGADTLQNDRDVEVLLDPLDVASVEPGLVDAVSLDADASELTALGDVTLAPAVAVGVDRKSERVIAVVDGAAHIVVDPIGIAAHVKLEDLEAVVRGFGGLFEPGMRC